MVHIVTFGHNIVGFGLLKEARLLENNCAKNHISLSFSVIIVEVQRQHTVLLFLYLCFIFLNVLTEILIHH